MKDKDILSNNETKKSDDVKKKECCDKDMCKVSGGNTNLRGSRPITEFPSIMLAYGAPDYFKRKRLVQDHLNARQEKQNLVLKDESFSENNSDSSEK